MEIIKQKIKNQNNEELVCEINKTKNISSIKKQSVIILHALTGKKENRTINFLAKNLPNFDYNTIQFDFSGHGESEGKLGEATISKQLEDIISVLNGIKTINTRELIVIGNSFSVLTALAFSKNNPSVKSLILLSGRANYLEYINNLERIGNKYRLFGNKFIDENFVEDYKKYNPLENIRSIDIPILIIHGENDGVVPVENAELFYNNSKSKKKELVIIKGADHRYSDIKFKKEILKKVIEFLKND